METMALRVFNPFKSPLDNRCKIEIQQQMSSLFDGWQGMKVTLLEATSIGGVRDTSIGGVRYIQSSLKLSLAGALSNHEVWPWPIDARDRHMQMSASHPSAR